MLKSLRNLLCASVFAIAMYPACLHAEESPKWFECTQDSDCVMVGAGCALHAVAQPFAEEADKYYKSLNARMDCAYPLTASSMKTVCSTQKTACVRKKFFGLVEEVDPASTCAKNACAAVPKDQP
ncbi:MAG TPA: hypothetical protein PKI93_04365 [Alphaproteobacteria bacterium]|nr:hypothetical protein [Alphaproteobacteria bacterium]HNS44984.1 hypothetical protein [Alphaproteobacteria bacterium]